MTRVLTKLIDCRRQFLGYRLTSQHIERDVQFLAWRVYYEYPGRRMNLSARTVSTSRKGVHSAPHRRNVRQ
jgi:hypothetical protein